MTTSRPLFGQRLEISLLLLFLCGLLVLHLRYAAVFRVDSDEVQHLHVVWGWTHGQLPYRDFFDNHAPLFSWLCAPLLQAFGERSNIVWRMRLATLPVVALCLGCTFWLSNFHFGRSAGAWATLVAGFFPVFFYTSSEVRPDTLWTALWLLALSLLLTGPATARRHGVFGAVFGLAFATSLKTILLAGALVSAALLALCVVRPRINLACLSQWSRNAGALCTGLLLAPAAFAAYFAYAGAWQPLLYCLIAHNTLPGMATGEGWLRLRVLLFPLSLPVVFWGARAYWRRTASQNHPWRLQKLILLLVALEFPLLLTSFWPLLTRQDYLPAIPLLAVAGVAGALAVGVRRPGAPGAAARSATSGHLLGLTALLVGEITAIFFQHGPWRDRTRREDALLEAILRLTTPRDFVMDLKGETIFRRRPFYYALEGITRERMRRGLIKDDIVQRMVASDTAVVHSADGFPWPAEDGAFIRENYLSVGPVAVLGKAIDDPAGNPAGQARYRFAIAVPADYVLLGPSGKLATGRLDGEPLSADERHLQAGTHEFTSDTAGRLIVFWAKAWKNGFQPQALASAPIPSHGKLARFDRAGSVARGGSTPR